MNTQLAGQGQKPVKQRYKVQRATWFDWANGIFLSILSVVMIFPFYYTVIVSLAEYKDIVESRLYIFPRSFSLSAYQFVFGSSDDILLSFFVSVFVTVTGTALSMIVSVGLSYGLSKKQMPGHSFFTIVVVFTMLFSAGLIPYYLTVKIVGLVDSIGVLIFPMAVNAFNVILLRNYMQSIPASLEESARIDGANDLQILWRILLPVCKPILATVALFYAVDKWNEWWHSFMFITTPEKRPLQLVLREILFNYSQMMTSSVGRAIAASKRPMYGRTLQMAIVVVASVPIMCVYPFLQKHFTKGIMIGAIKG